MFWNHSSRSADWDKFLPRLDSLLTRCTINRQGANTILMGVLHMEAMIRLRHSASYINESTHADEMINTHAIGLSSVLIILPQMGVQIGKCREIPLLASRYILF